jgi:O-methyltransferase domain
LRPAEHAQVVTSSSVRHSSAYQGAHISGDQKRSSHFAKVCSAPFKMPVRLLKRRNACGRRRASGHVLGTVLSRYPALRGILLDLPHVVREAPTLLAAHGVADRVTIQAGSFFETVPEGGDAYLLSHIIHDWNEQQCLTILGHCRRVMRPADRLLIIEMVLPRHRAASLARSSSRSRRRLTGRRGRIRPPSTSPYLRFSRGTDKAASAWPRGAVSVGFFALTVTIPVDGQSLATAFRLARQQGERDSLKRAQRACSALTAVHTLCCAATTAHSDQTFWARPGAE